MRRALVMSGGGNRIHLMLGAVEMLHDRHGDYPVLCGTSSGAILALGIASMGLEPATDLLCGIEMEDIYSGRFALGRRMDRTTLNTVLAMAGKRSAVYDSTPIRRLLWAHWDPDRVQRECRAVAVRAVDLETGESTAFTFGNGIWFEAMPIAVAGSSSIRPYFDAVTISGRPYVDGGMRDFAGIGDAIRLGADEIDVVWSRPLAASPWLGSHTDALGSTLRQIDIMSHEVQIRDLEQAQRINEEVRRGRPDKRLVTVNVWAPTEHDYGKLPRSILKDYLWFERSNYWPSREIGRRMRRYSLAEAIEMAS